MVESMLENSEPEEHNSAHSTVCNTANQPG